MEHKTDKNGMPNKPALIDTMSVGRYRHKGKQAALAEKQEKEKELGLADPDDDQCEKGKHSEK